MHYITLWVYCSCYPPASCTPCLYGQTGCEDIPPSQGSKPISMLVSRTCSNKHGTYLDHVVICPTNHQPPIILDTSHSCNMAHQHMQTLPSLYIPHTQGGVPGAWHHLRPVQVHTAHGAGVAVQSMHTGTTLGIPYLEHSVTQGHNLVSCLPSVSCLYYQTQSHC